MRSTPIQTRKVNAFKHRISVTEEECKRPIFVVRFVERVLLFHAEGALVGQPLNEPDTPGGVQFLKGEDNFLQAWENGDYVCVGGAEVPAEEPSPETQEVAREELPPSQLDA